MSKPKFLKTNTTNVAVVAPQKSVKEMDLKKFEVFQFLDPMFLADVKFASFIGISGDGGEEKS